MGSNSNGESKSCKIDLNEVKSKVKFYSRYELALAIQMGLIKV